MIEIAAGALALLGGFFAFVAGLGVLRLPDVLTRMHASTKAGTLGSTLILTGYAVMDGGFSVAVKVIAAVLFLMLTAPIAAHMIGRAAYKRNADQFRRMSLMDIGGGKS